MTEHDADYKKVTRELPEDAQIETLRLGWEHGVKGQLEMGFDPLMIAKGMTAFIATCFTSKSDAAAFFADFAAGLRRADEQEARQGPQTVN